MSIQKRSVLSGILYISLAIIGPIGFLILPEQFNVANVNDFVSTNMGILGVWFVVDLLIIGIEIILTIYLLKLFNEYNKTQSFIAFIFRMVMIGIMAINAVFLLIILVNSNVDASHFIQMHNKGVYVWQLFFSVHVFLLGYMLFKNNPTIWKNLGIVLILGAAGYLVDSLINLGNLDIQVLNILSFILLVFVTVGELGMALGLIIKKIIQ